MMRERSNLSAKDQPNAPQTKEAQTRSIQLTNKTEYPSNGEELFNLPSSKHSKKAAAGAGSMTHPIDLRRRETRRSRREDRSAVVTRVRC